MVRKAGLIATNVSKSYGEHLALSSTDLVLGRGLVHAVVGGNGAGKSTLLGVLGGVLRPSSGSVSLNGESISSVRDAIGAGVGFCTQEGSLVPDWTVAENFPGKRSAHPTWDSIAPGVIASMRVRGLPYHVKQRLEIARALALGREVLLADEPTAAMAPRDVDLVLHLLRKAAEDGKVVVWVTHDLRRALQHADQVVVLREGVLVHRGQASVVTLDELLRAMEPPLPRAHVARADRRSMPHAEDEVLEIGLRSASVAVRTGCISGIVGGAYSNARHLLRVAVGLESLDGFEVRVGGRALPTDVTVASRAGIFYMSRERETEWLFNRQSVTFNLTIGILHRLRSWLGTSPVREVEQARDLAERFDIAMPSTAAEVESLSGGNRQKAVLARLAAIKPDFLLLDEPFSGVDLPTRMRLRQLLRSLANSGVGIAIYSQETDDLLATTDRVYVVRASGDISVLESEATDPNSVEYALLMDGPNELQGERTT